MGRLSDKGNGYSLTTWSIILVVVSYIVFGFSANSIALLVAGVIIMDMGVQATHISNQAVIFSIRPEARNRLNTVYMVTYFIGGATGTLLASQACHLYKWNGVVVISLVLSVFALLIHLLCSNAHNKQLSMFPVKDRTLIVMIIMINAD